LREEKRQVVLRVDPRANKIQIKQAVEAIFGTQVEKVNTMRVRGKPKRLGVYSGRRADWKKAIVTIKEGAKIDFFGE